MSADSLIFLHAVRKSLISLDVNVNVGSAVDSLLINRTWWTWCPSLGYKKESAEKWH